MRASFPKHYCYDGWVAMSEVITVDQVARDVVQKVASDEAEALDVYLAAYARDPSIIDVAQRHGGDTTGFGEVSRSVVPYVVAAVHFVLLQVMLGAVVDEGKGRIRSILRRVRLRVGRRKRPAVEASAIAYLTHDQFALIRKTAFLKAKEMRLSDDKSSLLADSIVGALVSSLDGKFRPASG